MKILKIVIAALLLLSVGILIGIGYVWKHIAFAPDLVQRVATSTAEVVTSTPQAVDHATKAATATVGDMPPITVSTENLSASQQKVLHTLGINDQSITITKESVVCATVALGEARVNEIKAGAAPSLSEGLTLLSCLKK